MNTTAEIRQLDVAFLTHSKPVKALDKLDFSLQAGETLALLGESGSGKSLTASAIMRLLPLHTAYGQRSEVVVHGEDVLKLPERLMRQLRGRRLAIIFQEPMTALNPVLRIDQQLSEAILKHQRLSRSALKERMIALLSEVEMPEPKARLYQYPHQLSGGQKQRVVIAMALANNPDILIADEPTTALDVTVQAQILALLKKLQARHHMSLLLITHDLGVVKAVADRVSVMYAGQVVELAPAAEFFLAVKHPYSQQLLASLPDFSKRGLWLETIKGNVPTLDAMPKGCRFHPRCAHRFAPCFQNEPKLQALSESRHVRCHLYPEHSELSALPAKASSEHKNSVTDKVLLSAQNVSVNFYLGKNWLHRGIKITAAQEVTFDLHAGKTLALVGESGCGKTTTSRALLRLQPLSSGRVLYQGEDITRLRGARLRQYRRQVQVVFQDPFSSMNPRMMIRDILSEGMLAHGVSRQDIAKRITELLDQVNLAQNVLNRYPHQFSGGQRQRICIARALALKPKVLICDEPTSALDVSVQAQILNLLKTLQQEFSLAYLFITHNMAVVSYMADEVMVMQRGRVVEQAPCETLFKHPQQDYTKRLLESVLV